MMYNIRSGTNRWQIPDILSDGNSNVCSISNHLQDIHKWRKCQNFDLENEGQGQGEEEQDLHHSTGNVWVHIGEFSSEF